MARRKITLPPFTTLELKDQVWAVEFFCNEDFKYVEVNAFLTGENKKGERPFIKAKWDLTITHRFIPPKVEKGEGYDYGEVSRELLKMAAPLVGKKRSKQQKRGHLLGLTILHTVAEIYREVRA